MRSSSFAAFAVSFALAGCCHTPSPGTDGGPKTDGGGITRDGGTTGGGGEPLANLCTDQNQAGCEIGTCELLAAFGLDGTNNVPGFLVQGCIQDGGCEETTASYLAAADAGRISYDGVKAQICLGAITALGVCAKNIGCQPADAGSGTLPPECATMLVGNVGAQGVCFADVECQSGLYCAFGHGQCPGHCSAKVAANQPCDATVECIDSAACGSLPDGGNGCLVNLPPTATGGNCANSSCLATDYCDANSTCQPDVAAGGSCGGASGAVCLPTDECQGASATTCKSCPTAVDAPCQQTVTSGDNCPAGTFCQATISGPNPAVGSCAELLDGGSLCALDLDCTPPLVCLGSEAPGMTGSCGAPYPDGHACQSQKECNSGSCLSAHCLGTGASAGAPCDPNSFTGCAAPLWCNSPDGGAASCAAPVGQGQSCAQATCQTSLVCLQTPADGGPLTECGAPLASGQPCGQDSDCSSGYCAPSSSTCAALIADGTLCDQDSHCQSGHCTLGYCLRCVGH